MPSASNRYRPKQGYASIMVLASLTTLISVSGLYYMKSQASIELSKSLYHNTRVQLLKNSLRSITEEAFSTYSQLDFQLKQSSFGDRLTAILESLNQSLSQKDLIESISIQSAPSTRLLDNFYRNLTLAPYKTTTEGVDCGFLLGNILEKGPFIDLGSQILSYNIKFRDQKEPAIITLKTSSFGIPITNIPCIAYTVDNTLNALKDSGKLKILNESLFEIPTSLPKDTLPHRYRYHVILCKSVFEHLWSSINRNKLLREAYDECYFSVESWPIKQFSGLEYQEDTHTLHVDLGNTNGAKIAIVDKQGGLNVQIKGSKNANKPITCWIGSYGPSPTVVHFQSTENQPIFGYYENCRLAFTAYSGAILANKTTRIVSDKAEIVGNLFFESNGAIFENCRQVTVKPSDRMKAILATISPKIILSHTNQES